MRLVILLGAALFAAFPGSPPQDPPDPSPSAAEATLAEFSKAYASRDALELFRAVEALDASFPDASPEEQKEIREALARALTFHADAALVAIRAARALGEMGEEAAKPIARALKQKNLERKEELHPLQEALIHALGATKNPRYATVLIDNLSHKKPYVIIASAEALVNYAEAKQAIRKRAVEAMIKSLERTNSSKPRSAGGQGGGVSNRPSSRQYDVIIGPVMYSLGKLTRASASSIEEWRAWYNDNKKKNWDATRKR